jgi:hypothetical protein
VKHGICKLCLQNKMLCDSHLAPSSLYRYCAAAELGPVRMTAKDISVDNKELTAYLLCQGCEDLLNREGENWLLPKLATIDQKFPFYDLLVSGSPDQADKYGAVFACSRNPKIGFRKLTNFAIGVFWKASVYSWDSAKSEPVIELGKYREPFRRFLSERKPFPEKAFLLVAVIPPEKAPIGFNMPLLKGKHPYHQYLFYIPGIIFLLGVGQQVSEEEKQLCFFSNPLHPISVADLSKDIFGMVARNTKGAVKSKEVADHLAKQRS